MNYSEITLNGNWQVAPASKVETVGEITNYGVADSVAVGSIPYIGDPISTVQYHYHTNWCSCCYHVCSTKSAREQVIDEILTKMADAVSKDDFKQAKKLAQLAKAVKEL